MAIASDIIKNGYVNSGIVSEEDDLDAAQLRKGLRILNEISENWGLSPLTSSAKTEESFVFTPGQSVYTIGPGGDFDTVRPVRITEAYAISTSPGDEITYPICVYSSEEYNSIPFKKIEANWPMYMYYNPVYPLGELHFYPAPSAAYNVKFVSWEFFNTVTDVNDDVVLPPGYKNLLELELSVRIPPTIGFPINPDNEKTLAKQMTAIERTNAVAAMPASRVNTPSSFSGALNYRTYIPTGL